MRTEITRKRLSARFERTRTGTGYPRLHRGEPQNSTRFYRIGHSPNGCNHPSAGTGKILGPCTYLTYRRTWSSLRPCCPVERCRISRVDRSNLFAHTLGWFTWQFKGERPRLDGRGIRCPKRRPLSAFSGLLSAAPLIFFSPSSHFRSSPFTFLPPPAFDSLLPRE